MTGELVVAETIVHAEAMRNVRNTCRAWMTGNGAEVTSEEQVQWFLHLDRAQTKPFLWMTDKTFVGYGLIRRRDGKWWVSGGLLPEWRGKGLGKQLFGALAHLVHLEHETCWLDVFESNERAHRMYRSLGFIEVEIDIGRYSRVITMRMDPR